MLASLWLICYVVPAAVFFYLNRKNKNLRVRLATIYVSLSASILAMSAFGARLVWRGGPLELVSLLIVMVFCILILKQAGPFYILSGILQEWCLLLAATISTVAFGPAVGTIATTIVYALAHLTQPGNTGLKLSVTMAWGLASITFFLLFAQPLVNVAGHILLGTFFVRRDIV